MEEASDEEDWNNLDGYNEMYSHNDNLMNEEIFCPEDYYSHDDEPEESFHSQELDQLSPARGDHSFSQNEDDEWSSERDVELTNSRNNEMMTPENRTARGQISENIDATPEKLRQKKDSRKNK